MEGHTTATATESNGPALQGHVAPFRLLVDAVQDYAIIMLSPGGRVASWNVGAERITGHTSSEICGKPHSTFYPQEAIDRGWPLRELELARQEGRFEDEDWRVRKDGSRFWANVVITPIHDRDGTLVGYSKITRDLSERRAQEEALRRSEERVRLLLDGMSDYAICMLDLEGRVTTWSRGAEKITGYSSAEISGEHVSRFYPAEANERRWPQHELEHALKDGRFEDEGWRLRKDGSRFWANVVITVLHDTEGRAYGFAKITRDMTERKRAETLEYQGRNTSEFLGALCHELRDPLAPIRTAVGVMSSGNAGAEAAKFSLEVIDRQSQQLTHLVDELLDISRLYSGSFRLQREPTRLAAVVARALEATAPLVTQLRHTVITHIADYDLVVDADAPRLVQMLENLIGNAARFTPEGGYVELSVGGSRGEAVIKVKDSGAGIRVDMLPRVFDLFVGDRDMARTGGGFGAGLALVRRIAELHGGSVEVRSEGPGRGAEFTVHLPTITAAPREHAPHDASVAPGRPLRVMVVDDNRDCANSTAMLLRLWGHQAIGVYDGPTALSLAREIKPDAFLVDLGLPEMSGYEVGRQLRDSPGLEDALLVAMTGYGMDADIEHSARAGFDHHLIKPVNDDELQRVLARAATGHGDVAGIPGTSNSQGSFVSR
jgi:PAS domain S-box-containing protein